MKPRFDLEDHINVAKELYLIQLKLHENSDGIFKKYPVHHPVTEKLFEAGECIVRFEMYIR